MIEEWKDIDGYEGCYQISNLGRVKSLSRFVFRNDGRKQYYKEIVRKPQLDIKGYFIIRLSKDNFCKGFRISRLVAQAFIPNLQNLPEVNHKDGIKINNISSNLEWVNGSQNTQHAWDRNLRIKKFGKDNKSFKGRITMMDRNGKFIRYLVGKTDIQKYGLDNTHVYACVNGRLKQYKGYTFFRESL